MLSFAIGVGVGLVVATIFFMKNAKALPTLIKVVEEIEKAKQGITEAGEKSSDEVTSVIKTLTDNIKKEMEASGLEKFISKIVQAVKAKIKALREAK